MKQFFRNGNIGSVLGSNVGEDSYYGPQYLFVLNTYNKSWEIPTNLTDLDGDLLPCEGATMQLSANNTIAYIFGGARHSTDGGHIYSKMRVLNIKNLTWLRTSEREDAYHVLPRSYASSAIIGNKYFIVAFGLFLQELKNVNIFRLPRVMSTHVLAPENDKEVIMNLISSMKDADSTQSLNLIDSSTVLFIIFVVSTAIAFAFIVIFVVNRKRIKESNIYLLQVISKSIWTRRLVYRLITTRKKKFILFKF